MRGLRLVRSAKCAANVSKRGIVPLETTPKAKERKLSMFKRFLIHCKIFFTSDYLMKILIVCLIAAYLKVFIPLEFHYLLGLTVGIVLSLINNIHVQKIKNKE